MAKRKMPFGIHANRDRYTGVLSFRDNHGKTKNIELRARDKSDALDRAHGLANTYNGLGFLKGNYNTSYYKKPQKKYKRIK